MKYRPITKERFEKIKKTGVTGPGAYKYDECIEKQNWTTIKNKFRRDKPKSYFEVGAIAKKFVPGAGHYKEADKGYNKLSRPVTAKSGKR